jgi:uncharacterized protein (DUF305 family)
MEKVGSMKIYPFCLVSLILTLALPAKAQVEPDYDPSKPPVTTPWFGHVGAAERQADLEFIKGMRPHHAGALTMSQDYLQSKHATDPRLKQLAKGIIRNQTFEIGMMDHIEDLMSPEAPSSGTHWRQVATQGLAQKQRFVRSPVPALWGGGPVSKEDVRFAKAMIVHHEGALTMCQDYLRNPSANNKYMRLLCVDIQKDQANDINFMRSVINDYPGNPDDVKIDPSMIHGMEGMAHHGHATHTAHTPVVPKKKKTVDQGHSAHEGHHAHH